MSASRVLIGGCSRRLVSSACRRCALQAGSPFRLPESRCRAIVWRLPAGHPGLRGRPSRSTGWRSCCWRCWCRRRGCCTGSTATRCRCSRHWARAAGRGCCRATPAGSTPTTAPPRRRWATLPRRPGWPGRCPGGTRTAASACRWPPRCSRRRCSCRSCCCCVCMTGCCGCEWRCARSAAWAPTSWRARWACAARPAWRPACCSPSTAPPRGCRTGRSGRRRSCR